MRPMLICSLLAGSAFFPLQITAPPDDTPPPRADEVFVDTWSSMWDLETITYVKIAQTNIPEMTSGTTMQVGSYEASTDTGLGSFVLVADNVADELTAMPMPVTGDTTFDAALELIGGQQFTYRLVDGTFWQGIPGPGGREWFGIAVADVPIDVTAVFDGRLLLDAALASTDIAVSGRTTSAVDGGTDWILGVDADLVGPLGAQSGTNQRLLDAGFSGETGLSTQMTVHIDPSGIVTQATADLSEWWSAAISSVQPGSEDLLDTIEVQLDVRYAAGDGPLGVVGPCDDPETTIENGIEGLACPVEPA